MKNTVFLDSSPRCSAVMIGDVLFPTHSPRKIIPQNLNGPEPHVLCLSKVI